MCLNKWGNHDPENMRTFTPPETDKPRPGILLEIIARVTVYLNDPTNIPSLNAANGSTSQQRSERREACILLLQVILYHMDLKTMRCGVLHADGTFEGIRLVDYAKECGLSFSRGDEVFFPRAERAYADLVSAGILRTYEIAELQPDGTYKGHAAIRTVKVSLFALFGLAVRLGFERKRVAKKARQEDIGRRELAMEAAKIQAARQAGKPIREARTIIDLRPGKRNPHAPMDQAAFEAERTRQLAAIGRLLQDGENSTGPPLWDGDLVPA
jgi:hypothetical protein